MINICTPRRVLERRDITPSAKILYACARGRGYHDHGIGEDDRRRKLLRADMGEITNREFDRLFSLIPVEEWRNDDADLITLSRNTLVFPAGQLCVLLAVASYTGGSAARPAPAFRKDIAERAGMTLSSAVKHVATLIERGALTERSVCPGDRMKWLFVNPGLCREDEENWMFIMPRNEDPLDPLGPVPGREEVVGMWDDLNAQDKGPGDEWML